MSRILVISFSFIFLALKSISLLAQEDVDHSYLGVHTSRLDKGVSHQLGLPIGVHLQVEQVAPGSPADVAGVLRYDVLLKMDDQILINPEQLRTLLRMHNPGERITLSILRQSKPLSLPVELVNAPESVRNSNNHDWMDSQDLFDMDQFFGPNSRMRDFIRRHSFGFPNIDEFYRSPFLANPRLDDPSGALLPNAGTGGVVDDPLHGKGTGVQSYSHSSSTQQITVSDEEGSLQWTEKDGLRFLRATDLKGRVLFEGAITTEEDREKMSDVVGERLRARQETGQIPAN